MAELSSGAVVRVVNPSAVVQVSAPGLVQSLWLKEGPAGPTGPANTLSIGTVTTGAPGSLAVAAIAGIAPTQTLSLTIPRGDTGAQGIQGIQGATGATGPANSLSIGTVTTGVAGSSAGASITGAAPTQTLSLTIPRGDKGDKGDTGSTGPAGTVTYGITAGTAAEGNDSRITGAAQKSANLSDLASAATARANLDAASSSGGGREKSAALSATTGTATGDLSAASIFTVTPTGNITIAFSNVPASGTACTVTVIVSQGATVRTVTPPTGTKWMGAAAPTQAANKACAFTFLTVDGGTTWYASAGVEQ